MARKAVQKPKPAVACEAIPSTKLQAGTKESPIFLSSDDESEEDSTRRPSGVNAVPQKKHLGVSPSDAYTFKGHGSAYDMMIAMGYKPDRGLGPNLRGGVRPLPIELRKLRAGVGYRTTSVSRSPSPVAHPRKAPVKIIRPPKEPVASTSKIEHPVVKATPQTSSQPKAKVQKPAPLKPTPPNPPSNPPKQLTPTKPLLPPPPVISPPPPAPFVPSDLYISMMSGLAMANMPQTMQVAAAADPMAAFQLAQMYFAPPSAFPLPPFPFAPPQPDLTAQPQPLTPKLPPKPVSNSTTKSNTKLTPASPPSPSSVLRGDNLKLTPISISTSTPDPSSATIEMDPLVLKQKRQARKHNIGWIPEPGFPDRGTFDFVQTMHYPHRSSSDDFTQPDPQRSLVMEDLPHDCRTTEFVRSWSDQFSAIAVHLNGGRKALIEFPSKEVAEEAYDSPRLRDGLYKRAGHVRVFWYRPQMEGVASPTSTTSGNTGTTGDVEDVLTDATYTSITSAPEEPVSTDIGDPAPPAETADVGGTSQSKGKGKESSLPTPGRGLLDVGLPMRPSTAPTFAPRPESPFVNIPSINADQEEQRQRSGSVDRTTNGSLRGYEHTSSRPPVSPPLFVSPIPCNMVSSPHLRSLSPETIQRKRTPAGSPPPLRYPSPTPEMANHAGRVPSLSEGTSAHSTPSPTFSSESSVTGDSSLEQQLRMRLLAMKKTRNASRSSEQSSQTSTPSTVVDPEPDTLFQVVSPPPISQTPDGIAISESLELLATSFITDAIQAAQGLPSEPERFDTAIKSRLSKKRGSSDAFGSSADIAFKRQRLAQQIEESKRIMELWKAARTREERNQIYALWEESNRSVELLSKPTVAPFQWPCYAERCLIIDSDDEDEPMDLS